MDNGQQHYRCYGLRQLNPFRGVIQVLAGRDARAISSDGRFWEIQIQAPRPDDMWGTAPAAGAQTQFLRFGVWEAQAGLRQVPANPLLDLSRMLTTSQRLIERLAQARRSLPFPLIDRFELWLLDRSRLPLALIASSSRRDALQMPPRLQWQGLAQTATDPPFPDSRLARLEQAVAGAAGDPEARWFERNRDGSGHGLPGASETAPPDPALAAERFPPLLLRQQWEDPAIRALADDYLARHAARLLTLDRLPDATRAGLERQARQDPATVERLWRLYPTMIDPSSIDAARVEARIREAR